MISVKFPIADEKKLETLIRKLRIFLQLKQMAIIVYTTEIQEIIFSRKGMRKNQHISLKSFFDPVFNIKDIYSCKNKTNFGKELFYKLDGAEPNSIIFINEVKDEKNIFMLWGGGQNPVRYTLKILGKQLFQHFCNVLMHDSRNRENTIQQEIITSCTKIGEKALGNCTLGVFFAEINNRVKTIALADNAGLFLYDEKSRELVLQEPAFGIQKNKEINSHTLSIEENNIIVNVFNNQRAFYNNDTLQASIIFGNQFNNVEVNNILALPLLLEKNCIGVYCLINRSGGFNKNEEKLLMQMMSQITVFIMNTLKLRQLQKHDVELRSIYQQEKVNCNEYKYLMYIHQRLTTILIQETGIEGFINRMERHFKLPVVFFDCLRWKRIPSENGKQKTENFQMVSLSNVFKKLSQNPDMYSIPFRETFSLNGSDETAVIAIPKVNNDFLGVIVVFEDTTKLSQVQILALDRAAHMLTIEILKQKMAYEVEQNLRDDFLNTMISDNGFHEKDIVNMAANFGYDLTGAYIVTVLSHSIEALKEQPFLQGNKRSKWILNSVLKKICPGGMVFFKGDDVILLIPHPKDTGLPSQSKGIHFLLSQVQRVVFEAISTTISIGIGSIAKDIKDIKQSYYEARCAVDFLQQTGKQGVMYFEELGFYQLFLEQHSRKRLEAIAKNQLQELIKSDCSKGTYFLKTLERYFYYNGNLRSTSDDLHIHINTLRYRINVLKDIFNLDLSVEKCKFDTHFAIKTLSFLCPDLFKAG